MGHVRSYDQENQGIIIKYVHNIDILIVNYSDKTISNSTTCQMVGCLKKLPYTSQEEHIRSDQTNFQEYIISAFPIQY